MKNILLICMLMAGMVACRGGKKVAVTDSKTPETEQQQIMGAHNSLNSIDYEGTYKGVLPCADCEGISMEIILGSDTYTMTIVYLGKGNEAEIVKEGRYFWDDQGSRITLEGVDPPNMFLVGENRLIRLDINGERITGDMADEYVLLKQ